jgi:ABC-type lipoprotein export system ATPase subunit
LNQGGRTIVIITHEDDVASYASRVVRLEDGRVISDVTKDQPPVGVDP